MAAKSSSVHDEPWLGLTEVTVILYLAIMKAVGGDEEILAANETIRTALREGLIKHPAAARALRAALGGSTMGLEPVRPRPEVIGNVVRLPLSPLEKLSAQMAHG